MNEGSYPTRDASIGAGEDEFRKEQDSERLSNRLVLPPADGFEWKKYGQKFIKNIGKFRSYYKCQKINCRAKKRVEWSSSKPSNIRVKYDGVHNHASRTPESSSSGNSTSSATNQYNLLTQVFGDQPSSSCELHYRN